LHFETDVVSNFLAEPDGIILASFHSKMWLFIHSFFKLSSHRKKKKKKKKEKKTTSLL